jgi:hypothetical protein
MLVHMAPQEVAGLQALAMKHGGTLTINPDTGLPEAGFLSKILPMLAGAALNYFAPGFGTAISGALGLGEVAGAAAIGTGVGVGGATALATGSLSRGLMAGLGAYGGAGLTEGLMSAGANTLGSQAAVQGAGLTADMAANLADAGITDAGIQNLGNVNAATQGIAENRAAFDATKLTSADKLAAGAKTAAANPLAFAKANWMPTAAAALPVLSAIGTTTPMTAKPVDTGYIRQKLYDPYTQTYKTLAPVKASEWGNRSFSDAYTNPQTGIAATLDDRKPTPMADGGIVALASGGDVQHFEIGGDVKGALEQAYAANDVAKINDIVAANKITAEDVGSTWKGFDTSGIAGLNLYTPSAAAAAPAYTSYTPEQIGSYLTTNPNADIAKATKDFNADPAAVNAYISSLAGGYVDPTATTGGSGTLGIYNQLKAAGIDAGELFAAQPGGWSQADIQRQIDFDRGAYGLAAALPKGVSDKNWAQWMDANNYSVLDAAKAFGLSVNEVQRRYDAAKKEEKKVIPPVTTTSVVPGGTQLPGATVYDNGAYGNYGSGPATGVDYRGNTVSIATPGDIITNPDQTRTVVPNIPGRPYGGFTGMDQVKSAYTAGGGSLGYTSPAPRTMAEFEQMYNKQTGDSMAAYNYLMGKGAYPTQSVAASSATGIQRPYWSSGVKYKPKFLTKNADGTISSSTTSGTAPLTAAKTINVSNPQGLVEVATLGSDGAYHAPSGGTYDVAGKPLNVNTTDTTQGGGGDGGGSMARGGITHPFFSKTTGKFNSPTPQVYADGGYAVGGGLGSLGSYSDGGRLLKGPGDGVSDSIPATIGDKNQPARLADGEFVVPARIVSELGNGSTEAGAKKLYAMMDRVQRARGKTTGKNKVAANSRSDKYLPA